MRIYPELIEWKDITAFDQWMALKEVFERTTTNCLTVGFVVQETKTEIIVLSTLSADEYALQCGRAIIIPKSVIIQRTVLRSRKIKPLVLDGTSLKQG